MMKKILAVVLSVAIMVSFMSMCGSGRDRRGTGGVSGKGGSYTNQSYIMFTEPPVANFSISGSVNGRAPQTITFTDASSGASSWSWNFGDGQTSTSQNPTHTFTTGTAANVSLTVTNSAGSDTKTTTGAVDLLDPYWVPTGLRISETGGKVAISYVTFSPAGGGTVKFQYAYTDPEEPSVDTNYSTEKTSSATPPSVAGVTTNDASCIRIKYWVTAAPAGYATWGSASEPCKLIEQWVVANGRGNTDFPHPYSTPYGVQ